jgi:hypothetical protein
MSRSDWVAEIPLDKRAAVISGIVQQSRGDAFEHLMGNGKIADAMGGWGSGNGGDGSSDGSTEMSD